MGTIIEGDIDQVLGVVKQCFHAMAEESARISCSIKMDYREGQGGRLESKVRSVEERLGRELRKN
jgi:uncharacterized protein YqgV (UPF0045/DUF77 family)